MLEQTNLGPCSATPIPITVGDETVTARCFRLAAHPDQPFSLMVDADSPDEMTQRILAQRYTFPRAYSLLHEVAAPGARVLDLGAHIGTFTLYAAAAGFVVTAVEANPLNVALLQASLAENGFTHAQVAHTAISDQRGSLNFLPSGPYGLVANPYIGGPMITVRAETVDALLTDIGWPGVDFIKLDVEGSEVKAVRGMAGLLARTDAPAILLESNGHTLHLFGESTANLMSTLAGFGYRCHLVQDGTLTPVRAGDLQAGCNVDYLAFKRPPAQWRNWRVTPPLSYNAQVEALMRESQAAHPHERAYVARTLAGGSRFLLGDRRVQQVLHALQQDQDADVRAATAWWNAARARAWPAWAYQARRMWEAAWARLAGWKPG
ncbi:MAG: FkbM family methyltransferase [Caldilineaceae bacterium]|nr:FkbM family methyltransferase [Caldilineaceae bacterium]